MLQLSDKIQKRLEQCSIMMLVDLAILDYSILENWIDWVLHLNGFSYRSLVPGNKFLKIMGISSVQ